MHVRKYVHGVAADHVDHEVRKASDGMRAADSFDSPERRESLGRLENVSRAFAHLAEEIQPKARYVRFVSVGGFLELGFGLRLDSRAASASFPFELGLKTIEDFVSWFAARGSGTREARASLDFRLPFVGQACH